MRHWIALLSSAGRHSGVRPRRPQVGLGHRQAWLVAVPLLVSVACAGGQKRSQDMLYDIRKYNEGLRWDKLPQSAIRIPPSERDAFLDEREQLQDELRIDDFDITRLKTEGETQGMANVQIKWVWHMDREGIVKTTTSQQKWKRHGKRWLMLKETYLRGDEMPGLAEAEPEEDDESETDEQRPAENEDGATEPQSQAQSAAYQEVIAALQTAEKPHRIAE